MKDESYAVKTLLQKIAILADSKLTLNKMIPPSLISYFLLFLS